MSSTRYISTERAAQYCGLSRSFLEKLRVKGGGPDHLKVGRRVLYDPVTLAEWLEGHRRNSTSES